MKKILNNLLFFLGLLFLISSILLTPKFVGERFSADKEINNSLIEFEIHLTRVLMLILSASLFFKKSRTKFILFFKNKYKEIILLFVVFVCVLIFAEIILRIYNINVDKFKRVDSVYHHILIPDSFGVLNALEYKSIYHINSLGLRDKEYIVKKSPNTFRIIMLGDSYTEGMGVQWNETFSKILENRLNSELKETNKTFEVINAGVGSWSTILYYLWIRNNGLNFEPDLVIVNFDNTDVGGDIIMEKVAKYDKNNNLIAVDGTLDNPTEEVLFQRLNSKKSYLYNAIKKLHLFFTRNNLKGYTPKNFGQIFFEENFSEDKCFSWYGNAKNKNALQDILLFTRDDYPKEELKYFENSLNYAVKINNLLKEKNISFIFTTYPYGHQVSTKEWVEGRKFLCAEPGRIYSIGVCNLAETYLIKQNISVFNTCPLWRQHNGTEKLYYDIDQHFNVNGHKFMAELYFKRIKEFLHEKRIN